MASCVVLLQFLLTPFLLWDLLRVGHRWPAPVQPFLCLEKIYRLHLQLLVQDIFLGGGGVGGRINWLPVEEHFTPKKTYPTDQIYTTCDKKMTKQIMLTVFWRHIKIAVLPSRKHKGHFLRHMCAHNICDFVSIRLGYSFWLVWSRDLIFGMQFLRDIISRLRWSYLTWRKVTTDNCAFAIFYSKKLL